MIKPWYKIITPREDLRSGRPLDASEFAVHLDHVRDLRAPAVYQKPEEFFDRTYLTRNLRDLAVQVTRRMNGITVETSPIFNLSTQFGGGKTHALTLLWHLAKGGADTKRWKGVPFILDDAKVSTIPTAATGVFVGTEFDSITGRGGSKGEPLRRTPWGEVAWQLGGAPAFGLVEEHERTLTAPGGDVLERILPKDKPTLILMDELMNYISRNRRSGLAAQLYNFVQNLAEVARSRSNVVLAVSIPASEMEMTAEDQADFDRMKKLLDRLGKAMVMSAEAETAEIIRRRLFEWGGLPRDANETINAWSSWVIANKTQLPTWFPADHAAEQFRASYPFHPTVLSVFERKWQALPRFQQTRGILRLLALWVSRAYADGYKGAHKDALISLGTAPLDDAQFRSAVFEQIGEQRLEPAVTTDIVGKDHSHAVRLDSEASAEIRKARLHRKIATTIFFESNGGQQKGVATLGEVRLAVAEPDLDIGNVEQCLEALAEACYFLTIEKNKYRFSIQPNLNKLLSDRRATIAPGAIEECVKGEIQKVFGPSGSGLERVFFPEKSNQIADRPALTLVILHPDQTAASPSTATTLSTITAESGQSSRTFKSALLYAVAEDSSTLREEARKLLAWEEIEEDADELKLDETQHRQLVENRKRAERDVREAVWRSYRHVFYLGGAGEMAHVDMGLVHSSAGTSLTDLILSRLKEPDILVTGVSPNVLTKNWPPALPEWSTRAVRDAFYSSPKLPRLLKAESIRDTISKGLDSGVIAYVGRKTGGGYDPFIYQRSMLASDVEISDDVFVITREAAESYLATKSVAKPASSPETTPAQQPAPAPVPTIPSATDTPVGNVRGFNWAGLIPHQKWTNFYMKILSKLVGGGGVTIHVSLDVQPDAAIPKSKIDEIRVALRELGLDEKVTIQRQDDTE